MPNSGRWELAYLCAALYIAHGGGTRQFMPVIQIVGRADRFGAVEDGAGYVRDGALIIQLCAGCDGQSMSTASAAWPAARAHRPRPASAWASSQGAADLAGQVQGLLVA